MSKKKKKQKKTMSRFGKLYIAAACLTVLACALVVGVTMRISDSILRIGNTAPLSVPTPMPTDAFLEDIVSLPKSKSGIASNAEERNDEAGNGQESNPQEEALAVGLFGEDANFSLRLPTDGNIQRAYSADTLIKSATMGDWRTHNGIDIACERTAAVCAAADGTVSRAEYDDMLGFVVVLTHEGGYETLYANLASSDMVKVGQTVKAGDCLGAVGDSAVFEKLDAPHLHFELKKEGHYLDPLAYKK